MSENITKLLPLLKDITRLTFLSCSIDIENETTIATYPELLHLVLYIIVLHFSQQFDNIQIMGRIMRKHDFGIKSTCAKEEKQNSDDVECTENDENFGFVVISIVCSDQLIVLREHSSLRRRPSISSRKSMVWRRRSICEIVGTFQLNDAQLVTFIGDFLSLVEGGCKFSGNFQCVTPVVDNNQENRNILAMPEKVLTLWLPMSNYI